MKKIFYLTLICCIVCGCGGAVGSKPLTLDTLYTPRYANHFVVLSKDGQTILRVKNPWQGAVDVEFDYPIEKIAQRVITMSSSHSAFIEELGCAKAIVGVSGPQYLSSPAMQQLPDVGYDNSLNYEVIVALAPDLLTRYEISGENSSGSEKLASLGIKVIHIADYLEQSPLAKAEWIVAFGAIMGKMDEAQAIFEGVDSRYTKQRAEIRNHYQNHSRATTDPTCRLCASQEQRPLVMLNSPFNDVWYLPGDSSYIVELIRDAGGIYAAAGEANNRSRSVSIETAYSLLEKSDIWLNPSASINSIEDLTATNALLGRIKIPVYNNTARGGKDGGSDFWESGVLRCDLALQDLISILHPSLSSDHQLYYYKQIR